ncbi:MAG: branched-chain amino acid ABC transporter permease [Deltaproteobacteria bacterium RBG_16_58_17]|nr:MAG: branched-chain amino acid ABC transporter permease [Deltaproteobacteria bacterium RBG_16_58_17]OHE17781.1 MAG: branched-chain amino acid ABC transporter permease [Syntrophobacterales bacterium GWC2_56_13]OHE21404.1 MAG: branched-chain amino acid ABC transporter permease [Syntrophobacterales bacterium GWF2_56_9]
MKALSEFKKALIISLWFMLLTFPIMVIRVNTIEKVVEWRWRNMAFIGIGSFLLSFVWRYLLGRKEKGRKLAEAGSVEARPFSRRLLDEPRIYRPALAAVTLFAVAFPFLFSSYQTNIMTTALMYVMLGLGLNIVVGLAGLLDLGYVAFYAVGAYSYALLNHHFGLGFWAILPVGALLGVLFGILLGFPVLRLRGDYLAIVTLGFGEIIRLILENWNEFSFGPSGIANIPRPGLFGIQMSLNEATIYLYFLMIALCLFTIFVVNRLQDSRIGRAWIALREDEVACQAMGIDKTKTKLTAFALGATWAGMVGVIFAAKTTFINPASFTFLESAMILSIVVLGGMGSIIGVILGAFILILTPEYLRAFSNYRMLLFGTTMVLMMVFRPQGIVTNVRRIYKFRARGRDGEPSQA